MAALLSGGIDSALVCWALAKLNTNLKAFTISVPNDSSDEASQAQETAELLGIPHESVTIEATPEDPVRELSEAFSEPFACQSALGLLGLSRAIKPLATVLLTGDGGDDVFLGYPYFLNAWKAQRVASRAPGFAPAVWKVARYLIPGTAAGIRARNFLDYSMGGIGALNRVREGLNYYGQRDMLGERLKHEKLTWRQVPASLSSARNLLEDSFHTHRESVFSGEFLPKVDGGTMYYALEARAPFLDHTLWEFAASLPAQLHFHGGRLKAVLREIVRRRISPEVAFRPKRGFTVPVEQWLATRWGACFDILRSGTILEKDGWIRPGSMAGPLQQALASGRVPVQLWYLVVLEVWLRRSQELPNNRSGGMVTLRADS
jgi:asparagine synthase (glutamine-hydrolysing)